MARIEATKLVERLFLVVDEADCPSHLLIKGHIFPLLTDFLAHALPGMVRDSLLIVVIQMLLHLVESLFSLALKVVGLGEVCTIAFEMLLLFVLNGIILFLVGDFIAVHVDIAIFVGS